MPLNIFPAAWYNYIRKFQEAQQMKLTILGNNGPFPAEGGACSGYLLSSGSGKTNVLIECGTGTLANLSKAIKWEQLDAVILSHLHFDHMSDMLPMQYALQFNPRSNPLPVYAPETPANVRAMLNVPAYALDGLKEITINEIHFTFFPVRHPVECYALRAECDGRVFVYTGDTNTADGLDEFAQGADVLLADAGLSSEDWKETSPHLSARLCAELAGEAKAGKLLLTHLNPKYTPEQLEKEAQALRPDADFVLIGDCFDI